MSAIRRTLLFTDRSLRLRLRDCHSLWCRFPADFGSEKGCSPPHLPHCCQCGIRFDLTGFLSLILTGSQLVSFPPSTKMLHFEGLLRITALTQTSGSKTACVYPERFAACRVGLRAQAKPSTKWRVAYVWFHFSKEIISCMRLRACRHALRFRVVRALAVTSHSFLHAAR